MTRPKLPEFTSPDAKLIALCQKLVDREREHQAVCDPYWDQGKDPPAEVYEWMRESVSDFHDVRVEIGSIPATTVPGLLAKARMIVALSGPTGEHPRSDEYVAWSLARDMLALRLALRAPGDEA